MKANPVLLGLAAAFLTSGSAFFLVATNLAVRCARAELPACSAPSSSPAAEIIPNVPRGGALSKAGAR